jgi:8-oxo-dGTP pyrophosphatase MutT (NUDIX family)
MKREFSAGGVVLRRLRGGWYVAVIEPRRETKTEPRRRLKPVLALPKGWVEEGESPAQTAAREVEEETGVRAEVIAKLGDIRYAYLRRWSDNQRVFKIVSFYLLRYRSGRLGALAPEMQHEVAAAHWLPLETAARALSYRGERQMAARALAYLRKNEL